MGDKNTSPWCQQRLSGDPGFGSPPGSNEAVVPPCPLEECQRKPIKTVGLNKASTIIT